MRIIAIDYGRKRSGVAVTDVLQLIANGVDSQRTGNGAHASVVAVHHGLCTEGAGGAHFSGTAQADE